MQLFIGLMSGTSLDGVDAVLAEIDNSHFRVLARAEQAMPLALREEILALQQIGLNELDRAARLAQQLARLYAHTVADVLLTAKRDAAQICAIGCHGQTVRHAPQAGYTLQLVDLALLAELSGIDVIGDFRSRDLAAGGQGAPLVPAFHQAMFAHTQHTRVILNIGGIANLSVLQPGQPVRGFDSGPGNMLLDAWIQRHQGQAYDHDGQWAASGSVEPALLASLLAEPYFSALPPKSTGRDLFNLDWLDQHLAKHPSLPAADVQATLLALSVTSIAAAVKQHAPDARELYLCGGGARNHALCAALASALPGCRIELSDQLGLPTQDMEAAAFAWLAQRFVSRQSGNLPAVTGAHGERILGALYPR